MQVLGGAAGLALVVLSTIERGRTRSGRFRPRTMRRRWRPGSGGAPVVGAPVDGALLTRSALPGHVKPLIQILSAALAQVRSPKRRRYVPEVMVEGGRSILGRYRCAAVQLDHPAQVGGEFVV